ncbi:tyrosine-type recombinase/integrase [Nocardia sp. N2S4-5]|uniref:tyrosine-type recombinase/integrase n=1 Tax=Nocardia sp. N2S4-5 TaxID=3351565 RepID=UPI0037CF0649
MRARHMQRLARATGLPTPADVTRDELFKWAGAQTWQTETRRSYYQTFRAFWAVAVREGHAINNVAADLPVVHMTTPDARPTPYRVYRHSLMLAEPRERLMLRLSAEAGMRRGEVAQAHSSDLIEDDDGWWIRVHGKGGRDRTVPLLDDLASELCVLGTGYFFPGRHGAGHLTPGHVGFLIGRLFDDHTMHQLRHMFGTRTYRVKRDLFVVQALLGHASPVTTRRYVKTRHEDLRSTVEAAQYD